MTLRRVSRPLRVENLSVASSSSSAGIRQEEAGQVSSLPDDGLGGAGFAVVRALRQEIDRLGLSPPPRRKRTIGPEVYAHLNVLAKGAAMEQSNGQGEASRDDDGEAEPNKSSSGAVLGPPILGSGAKAGGFLASPRLLWRRF